MTIVLLFFSQLHQTKKLSLFTHSCTNHTVPNNSRNGFDVQPSSGHVACHRDRSELEDRNNLSARIRDLCTRERR